MRETVYSELRKIGSSKAREVNVKRCKSERSNREPAQRVKSEEERIKVC